MKFSTLGNKGKKVKGPEMKSLALVEEKAPLITYSLLSHFGKGILSRSPMAKAILLFM